MPLKHFKRDKAEKDGWLSPVFLLKIRNVSLGLGFLLALLFLFPTVAPVPRYDYQLDQVTGSGEEVIAPIDFQLPVEAQRLAEQRAQASMEVAPEYRRDDKLAIQTRESLVQLEARIEEFLHPDSLNLASMVSDSISQDAWAMAGMEAHYPSLPPQTLFFLLDSGSHVDLIEEVAEVCDNLYQQGILNTRSPLNDGLGRKSAFALLGENKLRDASRILDQDQLDDYLAKLCLSFRSWQEEQRDVFRVVARSHLRPNLLYAEMDTELKKEEARSRVPDHSLIRKGVRILGPNVQVTQEHLDQLDALQEQLGFQPRSRWQSFSLILARIAMILFLSFLAIRFLLIYQPGFLGQSRRVFFFVTLILAFMTVSRFALQVEGSGEFLIPVVFVAMLVAGLYDSILAMVVTLFSLVLLVALAPFSPGALLVSLLAGGATIFSMQRMRDRLQFYRSILYVGIAYVLAISALELGRVPFPQMLSHWGYGVANGLICAWLVVPLMPLMERFFDLTTDFKLLELTDLNRPILKRMKVEAPGTFQHSMVVSNLAEAAADEIGANALLAKVCAYYHDIGKLKKPEYYAENQGGQKNPHDKLSPNMSALIIGAHVKEGLDTADKISLPSVVKNGIPEHHGTTIMKFFLHRAREQDPHGQVKEDDFRYPGPKPSSPETAVLMLADTVEAMARSLDDPTAAKIRSQVKLAIETRLQDGQLEQCGLSIEDLAKIRESFITTLLSIYHPRIRYPSDPEVPMEERAGEGSD
ncbi:MAG: HDIG domain-containing protein [Candidatus Krumholzibacteria bacterium]|jgi:hypothetical protein|nr:HDIG domain-containing protein [Candidatus Krumholzibacteria bacterium]MDP6796511.1 HDIG domain-containing protein [Candidatus Krumholzibacteria bacterium]MDP7021924.1 HDIG domain-containing protein [Candidatus Krumholzibacteria bacterium]